MSDNKNLKKETERKIFLDKSPFKIARVDPHKVEPMKTLDRLEEKINKLKKLLLRDF